MHKWTAVETVSSGWFFRVCEEKQTLPISAFCQNELGSKGNTPENVISRYVCSKPIRKMIKNMKKTLAVLFIIMFLTTCSGFNVTDDGIFYRGARYVSVHGYEPVRLTSPVGTLKHAIVFRLANDQDAKFLYPNAILSLPYNLLARADVSLPLPSKNKISQIAVESIVVDPEIQQYLIEVWQSENLITIDASKKYDKVYRVKCYFEEYPQIYYLSAIYRYESQFGLLLNNGTIVQIDGQKLITILL